LVLFTRLLHKIQRKEKGKLHVYSSAMKRLFGRLLAVFGLALALNTQAQANGIDASKIRWSYLAAGGYVTDDKSAEGRTKNRRVEIKTMDLDASAFNSQVQTKVGSAK
jgi:hypothetical protein